MCKTTYVKVKNQERSISLAEYLKSLGKTPTDFPANRVGPVVTKQGIEYTKDTIDGVPVETFLADIMKRTEELDTLTSQAITHTGLLKTKSMKSELD